MWWAAIPLKTLRKICSFFTATPVPLSPDYRNLLKQIDMCGLVSSGIRYRRIPSRVDCAFFALPFLQKLSESPSFCTSDYRPLKSPPFRGARHPFRGLGACSGKRGARSLEWTGCSAERTARSTERQRNQRSG